MFKDREIRVKLAKTNTGETVYTIPMNENVRIVTSNVTSGAKEVMWEGIKIVALYIALDTARQAVIAWAKK